MRRRLVSGLEARRRAGVLAGEPMSGEEAVARDPELEDFVAAHSFEVGELLLKPDADRLSRFAFRHLHGRWRRAADTVREGWPYVRVSTVFSARTGAAILLRCAAGSGGRDHAIDRMSQPWQFLRNAFAVIPIIPA